MKKFLLFLLLITFSFVNAQINTQVSDYNVCDTNSDGIAQFDLNTKIPEILGNENPSIHNITFHVTNVDAQFGTNPIATSVPYVNNQPFSQFIWIRVVNTQTGQLWASSFSLIVNLPPNAGSDGTLTICNTATTPIDLYSIITNEQPGGTWIRTAGVGGIFDVLGGTFTPTPNSTTSVFNYILQGTSPCLNDASSAIISIIQCANCLPPFNLSVTNTTDSSTVLGWNEAATANNWQVLVVPFGSPAPTATSLGISTSSQAYNVTGLTPNTCYSFYVTSLCNSTQSSGWSGPMNFCTYDCTNNAQCPDYLNLIAFVDLNTNGIKDSNESIFTQGNYVYNINNSGTPTYGNANNGNFLILDSNPLNIYNLSFAVNTNLATYYTSSSNYSNVSVVTGSGGTTYYFPITIQQSFNDLTNSLLPSGQPRPGFIYQNIIRYKNNGTQTMNGTVTFVNEPLVTITSISQTGTTPNSNGFTYNFTDLLPNEERWIIVTMQVPTIPTVNLGDLITNSVSITPLTGDAFPDDNQMSYYQIVVGSYDPNDKTEAHGGKIEIDDFTSNDYLTYTIQFENTGTANAEFVRVEDFLDASLNPGSIEMLGSSHAYNMRRIGNQLIWNFYNINLPPTSINPTGSHGFIQFKIKPTSGFALGDIIPNKAFIYFDYNPPIITNEFQTEFVKSLKTTEFDSSNFVLYPNPTNSNINVSLLNSSEAINSIEIHDLLRKKIKEVLNSTSNDVNIDVSDLSKGVYLVQITTQSDLKITKKLIIQ